MCLFVCLFPNSSETANASDLKFWDWEGFRLKNIWIRRTVSWKIACILAPNSTLAVNFILSSMDFNVFGRLVGGGQWAVGRSISDRLSYRNHYMCSGEATSY